MSYLRTIVRTLLKPKPIGFYRQFSNNLFEPDYLEGMKSRIPLYDTLNIQIRGYDYAILESYQSLVHQIAKDMDIEVDECWALPAQHLHVSTYKPNSEIINSAYDLKIYHRTVQITDVTSLQMTNLLRAIEASAPAGVTIDVVPHEDHHEEVRYVPDKELITLKSQLEEMGGPRKK